MPRWALIKISMFNYVNLQKCDGKKVLQNRRMKTSVLKNILCLQKLPIFEANNNENIGTLTISVYQNYKFQMCYDVLRNSISQLQLNCFYHLY